MIRSISVIIPNFNGKELLAENLPHIIKSLKGIPQSEIIVVDDASTDNSKKFLKKNYPDIKIIENKVNIGFGASVNAGLNIAKHDLLFLINNDIKPDKDYISSTCEYFEDPDTFGVMGVIKDELKEKILEGIKRPKMSAAGLKYQDIRLPYIETFPDKVYTLYICGGNAIVDRRKMLELKGFQDIYHPFYQEDVDLSIRAWLSGWKLYFNSKAKCYHKHSATIKKYYGADFIKVISKRNRLILSYLYLTGNHRIIFFSITYLKSLYYRFLFVFNQSAVYPAYKEFFGKLRYLKNNHPPMNQVETIGHVIKKIQKIHLLQH